MLIITSNKRFLTAALILQFSKISHLPYDYFLLDIHFLGFQTKSTWRIDFLVITYFQKWFRINLSLCYSYSSNCFNSPQNCITEIYFRGAIGQGQEGQQAISFIKALWKCYEEGSISRNNFTAGLLLTHSSLKMHQIPCGK